jgi:hypothetical protein
MKNETKLGVKNGFPFHGQYVYFSVLRAHSSVVRAGDS